MHLIKVFSLTFRGSFDTIIVVGGMAHHDTG